MTRRAENIETLLAALQHFFGHRERHRVAGIVTNLASVEIRILVQLSAGDRPVYRRPLGALVGKEVAAGERILTRLDVHVDAAAGEKSDHGQQRSQEKPLGGFRIYGESPSRKLSWSPPPAQRARRNGAPAHDRQTVELRSTGQPGSAVPT